jgi:cytochrome c-type biogenesis protein CcmF
MRADTGYWGGQIAHLGVVVLALGIALSSNLSARQEFELPVGTSAEISGHTLTFTQPFQRFEERRTVTGVDIEVYRGNDLASTLSPRINQYPRQNIGTPAVMTTLRGDLYLSLNDLAADGNTVTLEAFWFPYIWLVWAGGFLTALGGVWSWVVKRPTRTPRHEEVTARV